VLGDVVLPVGSVLGHGAVDDVDQVAFEDASSSAGSLGGRVAGQERLCAWVELSRVRLCGRARFLRVVTC
jgi:hypothetical protein